MSYVVVIIPLTISGVLFILSSWEKRPHFITIIMVSFAGILIINQDWREVNERVNALS